MGSRLMVAAVLLLATVANSGCGKTENTGLVIEVRAVGLTAGTDLDQAVVTVGKDISTTFTLSASATGAVSFPFRFGLVPPTSSSDAVDIVVVGRWKGVDKVQTSSHIGFVKNERRVLVLTLYAVCGVGAPACASGQRCVADPNDAAKSTCVSNQDKASQLPLFDPSQNDGGAAGSGGGAGTGGSAVGSGGTPGNDGGSGGTPGNDGGSGGASGSGGVTTDGGPPACTADSTRCATVGQAIEVCGTDGNWTKKMDCPNACRAGACVGDCVPATKRCGANQVPQMCNDLGVWENLTACASVCTGAGDCAGTCSPGAMDCQGSTGGTPRVCDGSGNWMAKTPCPFVCQGGACAGLCVPGATDCSDTLSRQCDNNGNWQVQMTCKYACRGAGMCTSCDPSVTHACSTDGTNLQLCKPDGSGFADDTACPNGCSTARLQCNTCKPQSVMCNQGASSICNADGNGYTPSMTCDDQCGWAQCPSTGGPCYQKMKTYVINGARQPVYQFCEIRAVALAYTPPLTGPCDYLGTEPIFIYTQTSDDAWMPADTNYYLCRGQATTHWVQEDYLTNPPP
ncbi:MAG TPA: hypothetical protein VGL59_06985 [Polyangia bacterium]